MKKENEKTKNSIWKKIWRKIKSFIIKAFFLITNPRFLLCFGVAWMITNGWSYVMLGLGTLFGIEWMIAAAGAYLAVLWIPITPEKLITIALSIILLRWWFPNDKKTLGILRELHESAKLKRSDFKKKHQEKKQKKKQKDISEKEEKDNGNNT